MESGKPLLFGSAMAALVLTLACGRTQSNAPASRTGAASALAADGGLPATTSSRKGVIMPSDTGVNAMPSGSASSTGTSGGSLGRSLGNSNSGGGN